MSFFILYSNFNPHLLCTSFVSFLNGQILRGFQNNEKFITFSHDYKLNAQLHFHGKLYKFLNQQLAYKKTELFLVSIGTCPICSAVQTLEYQPYSIKIKQGTKAIQRSVFFFFFTCFPVFLLFLILFAGTLLLCILGNTQ